MAVKLNINAHEVKGYLLIQSNADHSSKVAKATYERGEAISMKCYYIHGFNPLLFVVTMQSAVLNVSEAVIGA